MNREPLLDQLKIDRGDHSSSHRSVRWTWTAVGTGAVLLLVFLVWFLVEQPTRLPVSAAMASAPVPSGPVSVAALLDASGYVVARRQATVSSKISGKVIEVLIEEGQHVQSGQVIARLDDSNARANEAQAVAQTIQAKANVELAQSTLTDAQIKYDRYRGVAGQGLVSTQTIDDSRTSYDNALANLDVQRAQLTVQKAGLDVARRALDDTIVRAPFTGVITAKAAQPGEIVAPVAGGGFTRTGIGTIVDMDSLEVEVEVAESYINRVREKMPAAVKLNAYPDWQIPAEVIAVIPTADRSKAAVTVRVAMKVKDARILPEMGARVTFLSPAFPADIGGAVMAHGVTVPEEAVKIEVGGQAVVFVIADGRLERRAVRLGLREGANQTLIAGVRAGEQVAIGDPKRLADGAKIRLVKAGPSNP